MSEVFKESPFLPTKDRKPECTELTPLYWTHHPPVAAQIRIPTIQRSYEFGSSLNPGAPSSRRLYRHQGGHRANARPLSSLSPQLVILSCVARALASYAAEGPAIPLTPCTPLEPFNHKQAGTPSGVLGEPLLLAGVVSMTALGHGGEVRPKLAKASSSPPQDTPCAYSS